MNETSPASADTRASNVSDMMMDDRETDEKPHVVFITGAHVSKCFQFAAARSLGLSVIVIDSEKSSGQDLFKSGSIDLFVPLEISSDIELGTAQCVECVRSLNRTVVGVVTFMEMAVLLSSRVAEALLLPGMPSSSVATVRDKRLMREFLKQAGVANVQSYSIRTEADLQAAADHVGMPAVLKPIVGADSLGVKRVDTLEELTNAFADGKRVMNSVCITSGLLCQTDAASAVPILPVEFLLEEYLDGPEVDIDVLMHRGICVYSAVSDNGPTVEPYFTETYGVLPSLLPLACQQALIDLSIDSLRAIGFPSGLFHIEAKLTARGPRLIEINARLGGGPICEMHKRVAGIDLAVEQLRIATGLGPSEHVSLASTQRAFAYMTTNAVASGIVGSDLSFLDSFRSLPSVKRLSCRAQPGDRIVGPADGQPSWLVELWMESDSPADAGSLVAAIQAVSDQIATAFASHYL